MSREDLLKTLREVTRSAALAYYAYMHLDREYVPNHRLHLREMHFLVLIGNNDSLTMSEIAKHLEVSQGAATQIASRLLKKELIFKHKDPHDKRYTVISLTPQGNDAFLAYQEYDKVRGAEVDQHFDIFSDEQLKLLIQYMNMVRAIPMGELE